MTRAQISRLIVVVLGGMLACPGLASAQSAAFTYQGQLKQNASPLTELVDLRFSLFDSDVAETPLAGPITLDGKSLPAVQIVGGLFAVELDFGSDALQQGGQWLQVEVRSPHDPSDSGTYSTLDPRQRITATPFALSVPGLSTSEAGVEVAGDIHTPGEVIASAFSSNSPLIFKVNPSNTECARFDDANCYLGLGTQVPGARLHVGGVAGVDGIMFPDGTLQTTAAGSIVGGDSLWSQSDTSIFYSGGKVGVGISAPDSRLHVAGGPTWTFNGWQKSLAINNAAAIELGYGGGSTRFGIGSSLDGLYFFRTSTETATDSAHYFMTADSAGRIAMGDPAGALSAKLSIFASGEGAELLRFNTERPWVFRQIQTGPSAGLQLRSTVGGKNFEITSEFGTNVATFFASDSAGNLGSKVGIGTTAPLSKLDITAIGDGAELLRFSSERPWVFRQVRTGPSAGLQLLSLFGLKKFEITAVEGNNVATFFADGANSRVGIGTVDPVARLDVIGAGGNAVVGTHNGGGSTAGVFGFSPTFDGNGIIGQSDLGVNGYGVWGRSAQGVGGYFTGGNYALIADGRARVGLLEISGADVAEKFLSSDEDVEPGTVMEIDPEHPGKLRVAREAYSSCVAGVVSGAGDIPVGAVLGNLPGHEDAPAIALSGRVWVRCDASDAAIAPGDMLTTSNTPGHAMKAADRERAYGTILGKSMTALARGERGLVLVLVNLQ